jgi:mannose-1-phosphate guanylyltransferase
VTLGITPVSPSTAYGYIQQGKPLDENLKYPVYHVVRFTEKPDEKTAQAFLRSREHSWNSGMFIWRVDRFLSELASTMPDFSAQLAQIDRAIGTPAEAATLAEIWPRVATQTVDYGVMEKARHVAVLPIDIGWSDVGSWASLLDILPGDASGNVVIHAEHLGTDSRNVLIHGRGRMVATIGLQDIIVVDTDDVVLVCTKDRAEEVKRLVERLKKDGRLSYL